MFKFCFPGREADDDVVENDSSETSSTLGKKKGLSTLRKHKEQKESNFYVNLETKDDVETMKVIIIIHCYISGLKYFTR